MDLIVVHGAPGSGNSTVSEALHKRIKSSWFEFGWIPEFRRRQAGAIPYLQEEALAFENLTFTVDNYVRHGFHNIIVTDLSDPITARIHAQFRGFRVLLVTLLVSDENILAARVADEGRSGAFRDVEAALALNKTITARPPRRSELRRAPVAEIVEAIVGQLDRRS